MCLSPEQNFYPYEKEYETNWLLECYWHILPMAGDNDFFPDNKLNFPHFYE